MQNVRDGVAEIVDDLFSHEDKTPEDGAPADEPSGLATLDRTAEPTPAVELPTGLRKRVICIPGDGILDEAAALILAQLVGRSGIEARAEAAGALSMSKLFGWEADGAALVCICYIESATAAQIRYAARRIRRKSPDAAVLVALLGESSSSLDEAALSDVALVRDSFRAATEQILATIATKTRPQEQAVAVPPSLPPTSAALAGTPAGLDAPEPAMPALVAHSSTS